MRNKIILIPMLLFAISIFTISYLSSALIEEKANVKRLRSNQEILTKDVNNLNAIIETHKYNDSINSVTVQSLVMTKNEFASFAQMMLDSTSYFKRMCKEQQIKIKDLKQFTKVNTVTKIDTIIAYKKDDDIKIIEYKDNWTNLIVSVQDSAHISLRNKDVINIFLRNNYKHRILWGAIRWGKTADLAEVVSENPNTEITSSNLIIIK